MTALDVRNFITEHVGRHGRMSRLVVKLYNHQNEEWEWREIVDMKSCDVLGYGADVVLTADRRTSKTKYDPNGKDH